jgi:hypothetical protein
MLLRKLELSNPGHIVTDARIPFRNWQIFDTFKVTVRAFSFANQGCGMGLTVVKTALPESGHMSVSPLS